MANQLRFDDLAKGLAESVSRHGKLRRAGMMLAVACAAAPVAEAEVPKSLWDCLNEYADALADCENAYSKAYGDADDAFVDCIKSARTKHAASACFKQYDLALENADLAFDTCEAAIAAKFMDCFKEVLESPDSTTA
jgi:hypothetical protein